MNKTKPKKGPQFIERCPKCDYGVTTHWTAGRKLHKVCINDECDWRGEPYTPPKRKVKTVKRVPLDDAHGGWCYEMFDGFGHVAVYSQTYSSEAACERAARKDIERTSGDVYGKCVAVIWPPTVIVTGRLVK